MKRARSYSLLLGSILLLAACASETPTAGLAEGHFLACAVEKTDLEQFPGEIALIRSINSAPVRQWLDLYTIHRNYDPSGLQVASVPKYYSIPDVLQMLQDEGLNVSELPDVGLPPEILKVIGQR